MGGSYHACSKPQREHVSAMGVRGTDGNGGVGAGVTSMGLPAQRLDMTSFSIEKRSTRNMTDMKNWCSAWWFPSSSHETLEQRRSGETGSRFASLRIAGRVSETRRGHAFTLPNAATTCSMLWSQDDCCQEERWGSEANSVMHRRRTRVASPRWDPQSFRRWGP